MLHSWLHNAGFFPIQWPGIEEDFPAGATYVRPGATELLRVFVPGNGREVEVYAGTLSTPRLRYQGPVSSEVELAQVLTGYGINHLAA